MHAAAALDLPREYASMPAENSYPQFVYVCRLPRLLSGPGVGNARWVIVH